MGGFESAAHRNRAGERVDMIAATHHDRQADADYRLLRDTGIFTVREGLRWHLIEASPHSFDFSSAGSVAAAARDHHIQVIWTLLHYGWPDHIDLLDPDFPSRFADFARASAAYLRQSCPSPRWYTPVNEISFAAWAMGEVGYIYPFLVDRGWEIKRRLVQAAIAAMDAIREVDPGARFLHCDPLMAVVAPPGAPDLVQAAEEENQFQYQAWDMLAGLLAPELGGRSDYLDIIGANFYHANIWEWPDRRVTWEERERDRRWPRLHQMLDKLWRRYDRPIVLSETSHFGSGRPGWLSMVAEEVARARDLAVPVEGICIYPVLDRPDWDDPEHWHRSGLWDLVPDADARLVREPCREYLDTYLACRARFTPW
jgi:hypothetical protein